LQVRRPGRFVNGNFGIDGEEPVRPNAVSRGLGDMVTLRESPSTVIAHHIGAAGKSVDFQALSESQVLEVLSVADSEGVLPLFLLSLDDDQRGAAKPAFTHLFSATPEHYLKGLIAREALWHHELQCVSRALADAGIPFLIFKGGALAYCLYPQSHLRVRCDADLLFQNRDDGDKAWALLNQLGYTRDNAVDGALVTSEFCAYKKDVPGSMPLDIHWNTNNAIHCRSLSFDDLYAESSVVPEISEYARSPSLVHGFILACHHRIAHMPEGQHNRMIWLYDLVLLLQHFTEHDRDSLISLCREYDIAPVCLDGIHAAIAIYDIDVDQRFLERLQRLSHSSAYSLASSQSLLKSDMAIIRYQKGMSNKIRVIREYLFPSAAYIKAKYDFQCPVLLPYYYLKRMIEGVLKRLG
jgi:Uncharacterised nucleotidyltransferase